VNEANEKSILQAETWNILWKVFDGFVPFQNFRYLSNSINLNVQVRSSDLFVHGMPVYLNVYLKENGRDKMKCVLVFQVQYMFIAWFWVWEWTTLKG
jgi:hypothetical protein